MKDKVQPKVVKERAEILRGVGEQLAFKFREQFVGETCEVLLENDKPLIGRCERYFMVYLATKTQRHEETITTDYPPKGEVSLKADTDSTDLLATEIISHPASPNGYAGAGRGHREIIKKQILNNSAPSCLRGEFNKNEIVKVKITGVTGDGAVGSPVAKPDERFLPR